MTTRDVLSYEERGEGSGFCSFGVVESSFTRRRCCTREFWVSRSASLSDAEKFWFGAVFWAGEEGECSEDRVDEERSLAKIFLLRLGFCFFCEEKIWESETGFIMIFLRV